VYVIIILAAAMEWVVRRPYSCHTKKVRAPPPKNEKPTMTAAAKANSDSSYRSLSYKYSAILTAATTAAAAAAIIITITTTSIITTTTTC
jgi:hypothetical protein